MTQVQFAKMLADMNPETLAALASFANGNGKVAGEKQTKAQMLANKDKALRATFTKRGYEGVVLMDRTDPTKPFNVKPYKAWIAEGRIVQKGEKAYRGLFFIGQTRELTADEIAKLQG